MSSKKVVDELLDYREAQRKIWESTKDDYHIAKVVDSVIAECIKIVERSEGSIVAVGRCTSCGLHIGTGCAEKYCPRCGQKIDWRYEE